MVHYSPIRSRRNEIVDSQRDTIAAIATPPGSGGIGVVRVSGPDVPTIIEGLSGHVPEPRRAHLTHFVDAHGVSIDQGLLIHFPDSRSFTGEPVVELQGHGGAMVMEMLLRRVLELGARRARPGEFSERAFLNDKMDLAQAEAVADLIASSTQSQARAAQRSLSGDFSRRVDALLAELTALRVYVEGAIDFPDEEEDFLADGEIGPRLSQLRDQLDALLAAARQGQVLRDGASVVIVGKPNVGKSTLMNALAQDDLAIVTPEAGTTRDTLTHAVDICGIPVTLIDTAGLRESDDVVETEGIRRTHRAAERADHLLVMSDVPAPWKEGSDEKAPFASLPAQIGRTFVMNKIDVSSVEPGVRDGVAHISAKTGAGLDDFKKHLANALGLNPESEGTFSARARHFDALTDVLDHLGHAQRALADNLGSELVAESLRLGQNRLSDITGRFTSDDLLGEIFSSFCIGK